MSGTPDFHFAPVESAEMIRAGVERFADEQIAPLAARIEPEDRFRRELWKLMGELGRHGITIAEADGGLGPGYLEPGITHEPNRTVTEPDNHPFSAMNHNPQPLHRDAETASASEFGQILVNSCVTFSLAAGLSIADTTVDTLIAKLDFDKVVTPKPTFIRDSLTCHTAVVAKRDSKSRLCAGIFAFRHELTNKRSKAVLSCLRGVLMKGEPMS